MLFLITGFQKNFVSGAPSKIHLTCVNYMHIYSYNQIKKKSYGPYMKKERI